MEQRHVHFPPQKIREILKKFQITSMVVEVEYFSNRIFHEENSKSFQSVAKVRCLNGRTVFLKMRIGEEVLGLTEKQCRFGMFLKENGFYVPCYLPTLDGTYCLEESIHGEQCRITVEEPVNNSAERLGEIHYEQIGELLGRLHSTVEKEQYRMGVANRWNLTEEDSDLNKIFAKLEKLEKIAEKSLTDMDVFWKLSEYGRQKKDMLKKWLKNLDVYAVHGDFHRGNLIYDSGENIVGILDFDLAGDNVLVQDLINQAWYLAYRDREAWDEKKRKFNRYRIQKIFDIIYNGYKSIRQLKPDEKAYFVDLKNWTYYLWSRRIRYLYQLAETEDEMLEEELMVMYNI